MHFLAGLGQAGAEFVTPPTLWGPAGEGRGQMFDASPDMGPAPAGPPPRATMTALAPPAASPDPRGYPVVPAPPASAAPVPPPRPVRADAWGSGAPAPGWWPGAVPAPRSSLGWALLGAGAVAVLRAALGR